MGLLKPVHDDYAFTIWDEGKQLLSLARDRISVKPLHYVGLQKQFLFGSKSRPYSPTPMCPAMWNRWPCTTPTS